MLATMTDVPIDVLHPDLVAILTEVGIVLVSAIVLQVALSWILGHFARLKKGKMRWGGVAAGALRMPVSLALWLTAVTFLAAHGAEVWAHFSTGDSSVAADADHLVHRVLPSARIVFIVFCGTLFVARVVRRTQGMIEQQATESGSEMDITALQALFGIGIVLVWIVGVIVGCSRSA
jgi:hypothetical protein